MEKSHPTNLKTGSGDSSTHSENAIIMSLILEFTKTALSRSAEYAFHNDINPIGADEMCKGILFELWSPDGVGKIFKKQIEKIFNHDDVEQSSDENDFIENASKFTPELLNISMESDNINSLAQAASSKFMELLFELDKASEGGNDDEEQSECECDEEQYECVCNEEQYECECNEEQSESECNEEQLEEQSECGEEQLEEQSECDCVMCKEMNEYDQAFHKWDKSTISEDDVLSLHLYDLLQNLYSQT